MVKLFLAGDVMTGRGIDQILPHPCEPQLFESYMTSAEDYVKLAEAKSGAIPRRVKPDYVWGDALAILAEEQPDVRIVNLETAVTASNTPEPKGINYRMNPHNDAALTALNIDCCVLANNHVLDWGTAGLLETLETLKRLRLKSAGAGRNATEAAAPAILDCGCQTRLLVFAFATRSSGVPKSWSAEPHRPGVNLLTSLSDKEIDVIARQVSETKRPGDVAIASIHWGGNWGFDIPAEHVAFAHDLINEAKIDVVHGHSSHHAQAIEIFHQRPILYGCEYRSDLAGMYFVEIEPGEESCLRHLSIMPMRISRFRLVRADREDAEFMFRILRQQSTIFGTQVRIEPDGRLQVIAASCD
jgi:poly-gamma-glutamate capsule biosynthesis protein CapA/YwtB (metallophosphatase superfamily)